MLELYHFRNSICSERPVMTLHEKGQTDWISRHVDLFKREQFSPEYLKINSKAQVPTLVHNGGIIRESSVICNYIDDLFPQPPLKPKSPVDQAHMQEWIKDTDESGYQGVASLSFIITFRATLMQMSDKDREAYWAGQTVLERTQRQKSCVFEGWDSPYAMRSIAWGERMFNKIEKTMADGRSWLMGDDFTLADLNLAPFLARLDGMVLMQPWNEKRPLTLSWWESIKKRPSYALANVGPTQEETDKMGIEGAKHIDSFRKKREEYLSNYG